MRTVLSLTVAECLLLACSAAGTRKLQEHWISGLVTWLAARLEDKGTHLADENISAQLVTTIVRAKRQVNVQQGG